MIVMIFGVIDYFSYFVFKKNSFYIFLNKDETKKIIDLLYVFMIYIFFIA